MTNNSKLENEYYKEIYNCFVSQPKVCGSCVNKVRLKVGNIVNYDHPEYTSYFNNSIQDCQYNINLINIHLKENEFLHYNFQINQYSCLSDYPLIGGTSFEIFGMSNHTLVTCKYHDTFDNNYSVTCIMKASIIELKTNYSCMELFLVFNTEHYASYAETRIYDFLGKLRNITITICDKIISKSSISINMKSNHNQSIPLQMQYLTGLWINTNMNDYYSKHRLYIYHTNNDNYHKFHYQYWNPQSQNTSIIEYNRQFTFQPILINNTNSYYLQNLTNNVNYNYTKIFQNLNNSFTFYAILQYIYGKQTLNGQDSQHEYFDYLNFHLKVNTVGIETKFADDLADSIANTCDSYKNSHTNNVLLIQNGAWDLMYMSLRRYIKSNEAANRLINIIKHIIDGTYECYNLKKLIFMTAVAHPIGANSTITNKKRGFRFNSVISAANQYFLKELLNVKVKPNLVVTIIDSYSIIHPRLKFVDELEYYGAGHYTERNDELFRYDIMQHTAAGDAAVEAMIYALTSDLN